MIELLFSLIASDTFQAGAREAIVTVLESVPAAPVLQTASGVCKGRRFEIRFREDRHDAPLAIVVDRRVTQLPLSHALSRDLLQDGVVTRIMLHCSRGDGSVQFSLNQVRVTPAAVTYRIGGGVISPKAELVSYAGLTEATQELFVQRLERAPWDPR